MRKDQVEMGGENYTNDRLSRVANEEDGYTDGRISQQAEAALEAQRDAIDSGRRLILKRWICMSILKEY